MLRKSEGRNKDNRRGENNKKLETVFSSAESQEEALEDLSGQDSPGLETTVKGE